VYTLGISEVPDFISPNMSNTGMSGAAFHPEAALNDEFLDGLFFATRRNTYVFVEIVMNRLSAAAAAETPSHRRYPAFSAQAI
jgi:hypothetical protein